MTKREDLNHFMHLNYSVILKKVKDSYFLLIPELSMIVEDEDLSKAYEILEREKEAYFNKIIILNEQDAVKEPAENLVKKRLWPDLTRFFLKTVIIAVVSFLVLACSQPFFDVFVSKRLSQLPSAVSPMLMGLSEKAYSKLDSMPPEKQKELRLKLGRLIQQIKPFTDEIKVLWEEDE